jgi:hypothetical protein
MEIYWQYCHKTEIYPPYNFAYTTSVSYFALWILEVWCTFGQVGFLRWIGHRKFRQLPQCPCSGITCRYTERCYLFIRLWTAVRLEPGSLLFLMLSEA